MISMYAGDDLRLIFDVEDTDGEPVELAGAQNIRFAIARGTKPVVVKELGDGVEFYGEAGFYVDIEPEDTQDLRGAYRIECDLTNSAGQTYTVFDDTLRVTAVALGD